ncbi:MAG: iron ABC transporter permease [Actinomycetia bacterium]|nr:iron ABC transporter permease [Actinomycetes bacterium]
MFNRSAVAPRRLHRSGKAPWFLVAPGLVAAAVALLPIGYLIIRSFEGGLGRVAEVLLRERTVLLVGRSLGLAVAVTAACVLLGLFFAFIVTRSDLPGRTVIGVLAALPLAIPSYIAAFAWVSSPIDMSGFRGAFIVLTASCYPYVYLPVVAAMRGIDPATEEVARGLGKNAWQAFWSVTARQVRPAAAGGALLAALYTLSDFGAVSLLRYDVFTRVIHTSYRSSFERTPAAILSLLLVLLTVAIVVGEGRMRASSEQVRIGGGAARTPGRIALGAWAWIAAPLAIGILALALVFPIASLGYWSATGLSAGIDSGRLIESAAFTTWFSLLGMLACITLAIPVGILAARYRSRRTTLIEQATFAGHALPGIVVALALVFFGIRFATPIYQRTPMLVLAYAVLFLPAAVTAVRSSVAMSSPRVEEVARSLGKTRAEVLRQVTLPLAGPGIAAGAALVLLTAMKELPATLLLQPTGSRTLATSLWTETGVAAYAAAAPYGLALVVLAVIPTLVLMRVQARR